jgi:hypothetical protein
VRAAAMHVMVVFSKRGDDIERSPNENRICIGDLLTSWLAVWRV